MRKVLEGSLIFRWLTAAAAFLDRQWEKSVTARVIAGGREKTSGMESTFTCIARWLHRFLCAAYGKLRLDRVLSGSVFTRYFFWCAMAATMAPIAPTMLTVGVVMVSVIAMAVAFARDEGRRLFYSPVNKWIYFFAFIYAFCSVTSVTMKQSILSGAMIVAFTLFSVVLQNSVKKRSQIDLLINLLVAAGFIVAAYGFMQVLAGVESTTDWIDEDTFSALTLRVYSTLENPNVLAEYLLLVIPLGAACVYTAKTGTGKACAAIATGAMLLCMVLTYSRGGWLGLIFSVAIFLVLMDRRFIVLGVIGLVALFFVLPESIMNRFMSIGDLSDSSTSYRLSIWLGTIEMLKDYWFSGTGTGLPAFGAVYPAYSYNAVSAPHAHNLYLQIWAECGICGIVALMGVILSTLRETASALRRAADMKTKVQLTAVISGMGGFLLQAMTDHSFYNFRVTLMFWVTVAVGTLLTKTWPAEEDA